MMIIEAENLVKRYGDIIALDHLNVMIQKGEIVGIFGPSGSGKTTAVNGILGLIRMNKGTIKLFGRMMEEKAYDIKSQIGYVPESFALFYDLTVFENVNYFCSLYINEKKKRNELVEEALNFMGLNEFWKFYPGELNNGILRRLNMACGIVHKPSLVVLDDPVLDVDLISKNNILDRIIELNRQGTAILYTSQRPDEPEKLCGRIIVLDRGRMLAEGTKEELKEMIGIQEKITIEAYHLSGELIEEMKCLPNVSDVIYHSSQLLIKSQKGKHNLINILNFLQERDVSIGSVYSERPSLNDVFLEITGKEMKRKRIE